MGKHPPVVSRSQTVVSARTASWSGPIPDPTSLAAYQKLVPDAPERILVMAEEEQRFRHEQMQRDHDSENRTKEVDVRCYHDGIRRGQFLAFIVIMSCIFGTIFCVKSGANGVAAVLAGAGFAGIAAQFISHKSK